MLQNPCETLGFKKNMVYEIPPYPASGLVAYIAVSADIFKQDFRQINLRINRRNLLN